MTDTVKPFPVVNVLFKNIYQVMDNSLHNLINPPRNENKTLDVFKCEELIQRAEGVQQQFGDVFFEGLDYDLNKAVDLSKQPEGSLAKTVQDGFNKLFNMAESHLEELNKLKGAQEEALYQLSLVEPEKAATFSAFMANTIAE